MLWIRGSALTFLGSIAFLTGCATRGGSNPGVSPETSLRRAALAWAHSFGTRDPNEIAKSYADDVVAWYPRHPRPVIDRSANSAIWAVYFKSNPAHPVSVESVNAAASRTWSHFRQISVQRGH
jgi:hypothetical protein